MDITERSVASEKDITFRGLVKATIDTAVLLKNKETHYVGAMGLVGMKVVFPERFSNARLRNNQNLAFFNAVYWIGEEVNDAVDIIPYARREGKQETIESIFRSWKNALRRTRQIPGYSQEQDHLLTDYQREVLFIEGRAARFGNEVSLSDVRNYRELVNAISIVHNAAALLGRQLLSHRLFTIPKTNLNIDMLRQKYDWILNNKPQDSTERKLCTLFNLVMGIQVIDDFCDLEGDRRLGVKTMATELLKDNPGHDVAKQRVTTEAGNYFQKAEDLGTTEPAWRGMKIFFQAIKSLSYKFPDKFGGRRERLLYGGK